jgi:hypothetical protein
VDVRWLEEKWSVMVDVRWLEEKWSSQRECMNMTQEFINRAFSIPANQGVKYPCNRCRNVLCEDKGTVTLYIFKFSFMPDYEVWTHHDESICQRSALVAEEEDDRSGDDRMDEILDAIRSELETNSEDPPTPEVQKFFDMLRAIKSKFSFSSNCYKELLRLISDVLPNNHKMSKDMYQSKKLLSALSMEYEKIDTCKNNCMLFYKEHKK